MVRSNGIDSCFKGAATKTVILNDAACDKLRRKRVEDTIAVSFFLHRRVIQE